MMLQFSSNYFRALVFGLLAFVAPVVAQGVDVATPAKRAEVLDKANKILSPAGLPVGQVLRNPFDLKSFGAKESEEIPLAGGVAPARKAGDYEVLAAAAPGLRASLMGINGESILVLGQRKLRVGESFQLTHDGSVYSVTISAIDSSSFTLRLNNEEFTRPIRYRSKP